MKVIDPVETVIWTTTKYKTIQKDKTHGSLKTKTLQLTTYKSLLSPLS